MAIKPETYRQLTAMANAADRGNRPTSFLIVAAIALLAGIVVLIATYNAFGGQRHVLDIQENKTRNIADLVAQLEALDTQKADLSQVYPPVPEFELKIIDAYDNAGIPFSKPPTIGQAKSLKLVAIGSDLYRTVVKGSANSEKLEDTLQWIYNVVHHPDLKGRVFLDSLALTPVANSDNWSAQIDFTIYETRRN